MMKNTFTAASLALALLAAPLSPTFAAMPASADTAAAAFNVDKASFVKQVTSSNQFEIESSKLAEEKARDADVKEFARQMIADHTKAGEGLKTAAKLDNAAPSLSPKHAAMIETLKGASEQDFQPLYIEMQTVAHMEAVTLFATYAKGGDDAAVKTFAAETLPKLEMHKAHVMKLVAAH
ncbi:putative membrane protein [Rhizobium sp. PP-F2F-G20b]|nr:putative membrane protein [Rhizobium sp. PP-F2F-G20b]